MPHQNDQAGLKIAIVYDNTLHTPELTEGWGFSAIIGYKGHTWSRTASSDSAGTQCIWVSSAAGWVGAAAWLCYTLDRGDRFPLPDGTTLHTR